MLFQTLPKVKKLGSQRFNFFFPFFCFNFFSSFFLIYEDSLNFKEKIFLNKKLLLKRERKINIKRQRKKALKFLMVGREFALEIVAVFYCLIAQKNLFFLEWFSNSEPE